MFPVLPPSCLNHFNPRCGEKYISPMNGGSTCAARYLQSASRHPHTAFTTKSSLTEEVRTVHNVKTTPRTTTAAAATAVARPVFQHFPPILSTSCRVGRRPGPCSGLAFFLSGHANRVCLCLSFWCREGTESPLLSRRFQNSQNNKTGPSLPPCLQTQIHKNQRIL